MSSSTRFETTSDDGDCLRLHLTFDDGPDPAWTPRVLDTLAALGARATFFVVGPQAAAQPRVVARMIDEGHEVALHCERHVRHAELDEAAIAADARAALGRLGRLRVRPRRWRAPWGVQTAATRAVATRLDLELIGWSVDTHDWRGDRADRMLARCAAGVAPGAVVLMHDGLGPGARRSDCAATVKLTERLIELARARGLEPLTLGTETARAA